MNCMKIFAPLEHPTGYERNIIEVEFYLISIEEARPLNVDIHLKRVQCAANMQMHVTT